MESVEDTIEKLNEEQEKLKARLGNLKKLISSLATTACKHKHVFRNCGDEMIAKLAAAEGKVTDKIVYNGNMLKETIM